MLYQDGFPRLRTVDHRVKHTSDDPDSFEPSFHTGLVLPIFPAHRVLASADFHALEMLFSASSMLHYNPVPYLYLVLPSLFSPERTLLSLNYLCCLLCRQFSNTMKCGLFTHPRLHHRSNRQSANHKNPEWSLQRTAKRQTGQKSERIPPGFPVPVLLLPVHPAAV